MDYDSTEDTLEHIDKVQRRLAEVSLNLRERAHAHDGRKLSEPEKSAYGIAGMSLLDLLEMLCDWKAAGERYKDGNITQSLAHNRARFDLSDQLFAMLENTVKELGW